VADRPKRRSRAEREDAEIVEEAQKRFKQAQDWESTARANAKQDALIACADSYNMNAWPREALLARQPPGGQPRPCLTFNMIQQHNLHVINEAQQNQMGVKVNATGFGATAEAADAIEGLIRHIEYQSNAQQNAYFTAIENQVEIGIGYTHIVADYAPGDTFDQELYIRSVPDPLSVWFDPDCQEPDKSDARWGQIGQDMPRKEFEAKYPDWANKPGTTAAFGDGSDWSRDWVKDDTVRVVRYYRLNEIDDTLYAIPPGVVLPGPTDDDGMPLADPVTGAAVPGEPVPPGVVRASEMSDELLEIAKEQGFQNRPIADPQVEWFLIAGHAVIDRGETVFDHIPLVPWIGREKVVDGKYDRWGHTRLQIDAQRMYNYSASEYVGLTALASRAQWLGDAKAFEGNDEWLSANVGNHPYLRYNSKDPDDGVTEIPPPQRIEPATVPSAAMQGMANAERQMQIVSGQYDAEMGAPSNERTGVAIQQRQRQADTATYHFTDRQGAALRLTGKILIGAIPKVYDTQRAVQILGLDGERKGVVVDPKLPTAHAEAAPDPGSPPDAEAIMAINPTIGRYDVEADVGPAYGTRRQEAFNAITQILAASPPLAEKIGDLLFKAADFPLSDEIAERLAPVGDDPNVAAANQALQQAHGQIAQLTQKLSDKQADIALKQQQIQHDKIDDVMEHDNARRRMDLDQYRAETDRMSAIGDIDPAALIPVLRQLISLASGGGSVPLAPSHDPSMGGPSPVPTGGIGLSPSNGPGGEIRSINGAVP
jgi:hypothetical protein